MKTHGTFRPLSCRIPIEGLFITQEQNRGEAHEQRESRLGFLIVLL